MKPRIPIGRPDIGHAEKYNVNEAMRHCWISQGPFVERAEAQLCEITGRKYAICVSSGTMALIVALLATDKGERPREVSVPVMTFAAVHNAVRLTSGRPVYAGADPLTWQVPEADYRGWTFDDAIAAPCYGKVGIADDIRYATRGVVIEDACESFGGYYHGRPAGSQGFISCVSFYANKICTSGEGGAILTDDEDIYRKMRLIANHGIADKSYVSLEVGLNARMTDLQAAILCAQLDRMPQMIARREQILSAYYASSGGRWRFAKLEPDEPPAPWVFAGIPHNRGAVIAACERENIEWRPFFPIPADAPDTPSMRVAREISAAGICLPLSSALTDEEVQRVCEVIKG